MRNEEIQTIIDMQRAFFATQATLDISYRLQALKQLKATILTYEQAICDALYADLGKSRCESYMCEIGMTLSEIDYMIKHLRTFAKDKKVRTPLSQFAAVSYIKPTPYGVTLIMSPWNYPFMLTIEPLIDALAAGNTAIVKPSAYSPNTSALLKEMLDACFDPQYVAVITGGRKENSALLSAPFDKIFFTGSQNVGREVMRQAAEHLTPVTLELGGKSPCIVDTNAKLSLAAKRIVFGKFLYCGQTCVAPDYIYVHESVKESLIAALKLEIEKQFSADPLSNPNYGKIINEKHFNRLLGLIRNDKLIHGGHFDADTLKIEPTILNNVTWNDKVMQEEIFGPILPILTYQKIDDVIHQINTQPHPLALYIFSENKTISQHVIKSCQFGGGCVNDVLIHLATSEMGFGGFGASGMGAYHGKAGFDEFSHKKSIVDKKTWLDLPMRYQPYTKLNEKLIRFFMK